MPQQFSGFPRETFNFLTDLQANNNKDWYAANRDRYEAYWKAPGLALINALVPAMAALSPPLKAEARINGSLRRINRDVRFSRDKSPYNARLHMIFWSGSHPNRSPAFHFVLNADGIGYGAGVFGVDANTLSGFRNRILDTKHRSKLLAAIRQAEKIGCNFDVPELKRLPSGYQADNEWEHLLRRKAFVMRTLHDLANPDWLHGDTCVPQVMKIANDLMPLIRWLSK